MPINKVQFILISLLLLFSFCKNTENKKENTINSDSLEWIMIQDTLSEISLNDFINKYPDGNFTTLAKQKLEELEKEKKAWNELKNCHSLKRYKMYIENFPNGFYIDSAMIITSELEKLKGKEFLDKYAPKLNNFINFIDTLNYHYPYDWFEDFWFFVKGNELKYSDSEIETLKIQKNEDIGSYNRAILSDFLKKIKSEIDNNYQIEICEQNVDRTIIFTIYLHCIAIEYIENNDKIFIVSLYHDTRC